ncbi:MAG TPA: response regulator [Candidatus Saccharimonadales bacterium]|jgi:PAS domain S-box-containing protein|nr:response regulator [Candidatus Saccharimonadales bacterium]
MSLSAPSRNQFIGFAVLILVVQRAGFIILGPGQTGTLFIAALGITINLLAIGSSLAAAKRGRGVFRIFWLLFSSAFVLHLVADTGWAYYRYFGIAVPETALFPSLFYRLYAAPMAITLFLSDDVRTSRLETFLDGCIVVGLVGLGMYQIQLAELNAHDPNIGQLITTTTVVNVILLLAALARFVFSTPGMLRGLYGRLAIFFAAYSLIAFATSYVDAYFPTVDQSFDLFWIVPYLVASALAITWRPDTSEDKPAEPRISRRAALLCFNLSMAAMVLSSAVLGLRVVDASRIVGLVAVAVVLFSYAVRCALMQDSQEKYVAALQESNTRYKCVSLATNDVLWDRSLANDSVTWNENLYSLFDYQLEDLPTDRGWWISKIHPDDREHILGSIQAAIESENSAWSVEYRFKKAGGSYAFVLDRGYVVRDAHGRPLRTIGSMQDLSVRKQAELEIQRAQKAAEAAAQAKTDFLSNMSHEIRTPLNGILGTLELAAQTQMDPQQEELLALAGESASALLSVVNDVLDFSKVEMGKMELEKKAMDISDTVAEATRTVMARAHQKGLELLYYVAADVPALVVGDSVRLKQVLMNLLGNAVKFTEQGEIVLRVEVEACSASLIDLRFAVSDTGIGIPPEQHRVIFQPFSQADTSVTRRFGGTGLGLAICSKIVDLLKGRIWVESGHGKGSTFFFTAKFDLGPSIAANAGPAGVELSGLRILVADAHTISRAFLQELLTSRGAEVTGVGTAGQCIECLNRAISEARPYKVLLADQHLKGTDGFAMVEQVKQSHGPSPRVVMMLRSDDHQNAVAQCRKAGIASHLIKPFKRSELLFAIARALTGATAGRVVTAPSTDVTKSPSRPLTVLLAEDNLVNRKLAVRMLEKLGHHVKVAENGLQALETVKSVPIDLVLMDGHMPEMDGLVAARAIRAWEADRGTHIPIIAMTAMVMEGDEEACRQAGMNGYIAKPIDMKVLEKAIRMVMDESAPPAQPRWENEESKVVGSDLRRDDKIDSAMR